jgi:hypothetical protein
LTKSMVSPYCTDVLAAPFNKLIFLELFCQPITAKATIFCLTVFSDRRL